MLDASEDELFEVRDVTGAEVPPRAFVHVSVECAECGEPTMETRIRRFGGRELCPPWAIRGRSAPMRIAGSRSDTAAAAD